MEDKKKLCCFALSLAHELFDEDEEESNEVSKISNFTEQVLEVYCEKEFKSHFRLTKIQFEELLRNLQTVYIPEVKRGTQEISLEKKLLIFIWYISNMESLRSVANRFGISKGSAHNIIKHIVAELLKVNVDFKIIGWPTQEQKEQTKSYFLQQNGIPGIVGAIDGCHIKIDAPQYSPSSYINRKGFPSIILQAICNEKMEFIDVYVGEVGSVHDACVFRRSEIYSRLRHHLLSEDEHIIGDSAYPVSTFLLAPYKDNGFLTARQKLFNTKLSASRIKIEQAFGLLKMRFRRLKYVETKNIETIVQLVMAGCILHNICLKSRGDNEEDNFEYLDVDNNDEENATSFADCSYSYSGQHKRDTICQNL